jgi:hypothetical protein
MTRKHSPPASSAAGMLTAPTFAEALRAAATTLASITVPATATPGSTKRHPRRKGCSSDIGGASRDGSAPDDSVLPTDRDADQTAARQYTPEPGSLPGSTSVDSSTADNASYPASATDINAAVAITPSDPADPDDANLAVPSPYSSPMAFAASATSSTAHANAITNATEATAAPAEVVSPSLAGQLCSKGPSLLEQYRASKVDVAARVEESL